MLYVLNLYLVLNKRIATIAYEPRRLVDSHPLTSRPIPSTVGVTSSNYVQQWAESMPLQDVGKLLSALK